MSIITQTQNNPSDFDSALLGHGSTEFFCSGLYFDNNQHGPACFRLGLVVYVKVRLCVLIYEAHIATSSVIASSLQSISPV